jgi:dTDP-4-amino-4,6-dideoxygalactose transaminase
MSENKLIPFFDDKIDKLSINFANKVLKSSHLTRGKFSEKFEKAFLKKLLPKNAKIQGLALSSCTAALHLAIKSMNLKKNDEVIVPSLSFAADANVVNEVGAKVVFADVKSLDDLTICPNDIKKKITKKTKALIVMHYGGYPCDISIIKNICKKHKIFLIEDSCHALFSKYKKKKLGTYGDIGVFSFYGNKNMTTGEGGMLVGRKETIKKIKQMSSHGINFNSLERIKKKNFFYNITSPGLNYRIDDIRSAIGFNELKKLNKKNIKRYKLYKNYITLIKKYNLEKYIKIPFSKKIHKNLSFHIFPVILKKHNNLECYRYLLKKGVATSMHYPPIHKFDYYQKKNKQVLNITEKLEDRLISLPIYPNLSSKKQLRIIIVLRDFLFKKNI